MSNQAFLFKKREEGRGKRLATLGSDGRWKMEDGSKNPGRGKMEAISCTWVRGKMEEGRWKQKTAIPTCRAISAGEIHLPNFVQD